MLRLLYFKTRLLRLKTNRDDVLVIKSLDHRYSLLFYCLILKIILSLPDNYNQKRFIRARSDVFDLLMGDLLMDNLLMDGFNKYSNPEIARTFFECAEPLATTKEAGSS